MKEYVSKIILEHISNLKKKIQVEKINHQIIEIGDYINVPEITSEIENHLHTDNDIQRYVIQTLINDSITNFKNNERIYNQRRLKLQKLKELDLPDQRSPEWYQLRKKILTASSLGTAIDKGHFQTRDELLLDKIIERNLTGLNPTRSSMGNSSSNGESKKLKNGAKVFLHKVSKPELYGVAKINKKNKIIGIKEKPKKYY